MTVLVGNHDFLTGCKLNGDSVLNAEFCLEYVEISTNGVIKSLGFRARPYTKMDSHGQLATLQNRWKQYLLKIGRKNPGDMPIVRTLNPSISSLWSLLLPILSIGAVILLLACLNLASLIAAQVLQKKPEIGLRKALGATTGNIQGLFFANSVKPCLISGLVGFAIYSMGALVYQAFLPADELPIIRVDLLVFLYAVAISLLAGVATSWLASWRIARLAPAVIMYDRDQKPLSRRRLWFTSGHVKMKLVLIMEIAFGVAAVACVLAGVNVYVSGLSNPMANYPERLLILRKRSAQDDKDGKANFFSSYDLELVKNCLGVEAASSMWTTVLTSDKKKSWVFP